MEGGSSEQSWAPLTGTEETQQSATGKRTEILEARKVIPLLQPRPRGTFSLGKQLRREKDSRNAGRSKPGGWLRREHHADLGSEQLPGPEGLQEAEKEKKPGCPE